MDQSKPQLGDIVLYRAATSVADRKPCPAMVLNVRGDGSLDLQVFGLAGMHVVKQVLMLDIGADGTIKDDRAAWMTHAQYQQHGDKLAERTGFADYKPATV